MSDRQIKIRRWDYTERTMTSPFLELPGQYVGMHSGFFNYPGRHVYQTWVGVSDKNGNDIYEGDFVEWIVTPLWLRYDYEWEEWKSKGEYKQIIVNKVNWKGDCFESHLRDANPKECRIIGNIFENPSLEEERWKRRHTDDPDIQDYYNKIK